MPHHTSFSSTSISFSSSSPVMFLLVALTADELLAKLEKPKETALRLQKVFEEYTAQNSIERRVPCVTVLTWTWRMPLLVCAECIDSISHNVIKLYPLYIIAHSVHCACGCVWERERRDGQMVSNRYLMEGFEVWIWAQALHCGILFILPQFTQP